MRECVVRFANADDIRRFVAIATRQRFSVHVEADQMQTNGECIMGMFCMGCNRPLYVRFPAEADASGFLQELQPFLVA